VRKSIYARIIFYPDNPPSSYAILMSFQPSLAWLLINASHASRWAYRELSRPAEGAQAAQHKAISTSVPAEMMDPNNIENLVLAETKDHWNWETLAAVAPRIGDSELKRMARKAVSEVRKQEKTHLNSNRCCGSSLRAHVSKRAKTLRAPAMPLWTLARSLVIIRLPSFVGCGVVRGLIAALREPTCRSSVRQADFLGTRRPARRVSARHVGSWPLELLGR
jgi:hypothetical protein